MPMIDAPTIDSPGLATSREVSPRKSKNVDGSGDRALRDAMIIVLAAWVLLFVLAFSLNRYNV